jgi:hypothetical protein
MKYWTMDLTIDPNDATQNTWYVCVYSGWGGAPNGQGGLYRTTNRGTTWTKIINSVNSNNGDTTSCFSISFDPVNKGAAYLTTETGGLFYSANAEASRPVFTQLLDYPFEQPTRVFFNPYIKSNLWVNSFGNGMEMGVVPILTSVNQIPAQNGAVNLYPNPNHGRFYIESSVDSRQWSVEVYNILGEKVYSSMLNTGVNQIVINNDSKGIYMYRILDKEGDLVSAGKVEIQ